MLPQVNAESGGAALLIAILVAIALAVGIARWATRRRMETGQSFPTLGVNLGILIGLPLVAYIAAGTDLTVEYPVLQGFNFQGGLQVRPEFLALAFRADDLHRRLHRRDRARRHHGGQPRADGSFLFAGPPARPHAAAGRHTAGAARHHSRRSPAST